MAGCTEVNQAAAAFEQADTPFLFEFLICMVTVGCARYSLSAVR
ncbi:hypothetical protein [Alicyclobacillus herbarius]|nr:hypothetical protein [Alicyclobacillus herbarius]